MVEFGLVAPALIMPACASWVHLLGALVVCGEARVCGEAQACEEVHVASAPASDMDEDDLDLTAFNAMKADDLVTAQATFSELLLRDSEDAFAAMWLGHIAVRQANLPLAEAAFSHAVESVSSRMWVEDANEEFALLAKRAQLSLSLRRVRERRSVPTSATSDDSEAAGLIVSQIPRVHWSELSHEQFKKDFATARRPVIIEGFDSLSEPAWSVDRLRSVCGPLPAPVRRFEKTSTAWGGLESALPEGSATPTFGDYLDALAAVGYDGKAAGPEGGAVLFDWSLRLKGGCAALLPSLRIPSYFGQEVVSGYGPSLFVQPNGTRCGLHVDQGSTHFWQHVLTGGKRWRIFAPEDWPRLFSGVRARDSNLHQPCAFLAARVVQVPTVGSAAPMAQPWFPGDEP